MTDQISACRAKVVAAHPAAFALHTKVASTLEEAARKTARARLTVVHVVLDMLMIQGMKSHVAVSLLSQHGLMEDTATITRRLLELAVQAVYIGAESEKKERERRAGMYPAFLWRQLPQRVKRHLPPPVKEEWSKTARSYGRFVPKKAKSWGPIWIKMFRAIGGEDPNLDREGQNLGQSPTFGEKLYRKDYTFLSGIAHGSPDHQILVFSRNTIKVHSHEFAPVLLRYSSRYYLAVAEQWNNLFGALSKDVLDGLMRQVMQEDS